MHAVKIFSHPLARGLRLGAGCAVLFGLAGSDADVRASDTFFADIPPVLTASRLAQSPLDAPAPVTVIDREMIAASGFNEIHDLLRLVPGFLVADNADSAPAVASHGLGDAYARRIKVMIDGRTINSPLWGNVIWDNLPLRVDDIDRIEVVRGPNGAAYGVNAFQGVVNIITRAPTTESGHTLITRIGRNGFYDHGVRLNGTGEGAFDWRLSASRRAETSFEPYYQAKNRIWHSSESLTRSTANFSSTLQLSATDELSLQLGFSEGPTQRGAEAYSDYPPHTERDRALHLHLGWQRRIDADSGLSLQYSQQREQASGTWPVTQRYQDLVATFPSSRDSEVRRHDLELQYDTRLGERLTAMLGLGVRTEHARSMALFGTGRWLDDTHGQVFGSVSWKPLDALTVGLGGTLEYHDYSGQLFSPRLALNHALGADAALRFSTGTAYRAPSLMESRAFQTDRQDGVIRRIHYRVFDPLESERMRFVDLGYVAQLRSLGVMLDARLFREHYRRFIDDKSCWAHTCPRPEPADYLPIDPGKKSFYFFNANDFRMTGAEFTLDWRREGWGRAVLSQAFIRIDGGEPYSDRDIPESAPDSMTSLLLIKELPGRWQASLGYYHNARYYWMNGGDIVPSSDRVDLRLARRFGAPGSDNEFSISALSVKGRYVDFHEGKFRHEPQLFATLRIGW
ncbi:TonB-dependent receptor [Thauera sp.]|jgi:iron complex outermembrane receptor protein|uniref:TonB-dependent receptor plug domain-containing protein n=1 Tax=Thauera sp. TaxID=1905334 RepID=UPI00260722BD|nr:TonB-dependent receptor [Thauera sp.]MCK6407800.1 TonB-dependent receptor [Thauera sp.]